MKRLREVIWLIAIVGVAALFAGLTRTVSRPPAAEPPPEPPPWSMDVSSPRDDMFGAIEAGRLERVKELVARDRRLLETTGEFGAPLELAIARRQRKVALFLISAGASVTRPPGDGKSALWWAAAWGWTDVVTLLLDHGARIQEGYRTSGDSPLHIAAYAGHLHTIDILLSRGAHVNALNRFGQTPLDVARAYATATNADAVEKLLVFRGGKPGSELRGRSHELFEAEGDY